LILVQNEVIDVAHFVMDSDKVLLIDVGAHFDPEVITIEEVPGTSCKKIE
jgi:hypothetical protein